MAWQDRPDTYEAHAGAPLRHRWSASALADFKKCPWYYLTANIGGWRRPRNFDLVFGTALHDALWAYHDRAPDGPGAALHAAVRVALAAPLPDDDSETVKTRPNLVRGLVDWADSYGVGTLGWLPLLAAADTANEIPFEIALGITTPSGRPYTLYGVLDRVVVLKGRPAIVDAKSTGFAMGSFYFDRYRPDTQISTYAGAGFLLFNGYRGKVLIDAFFIARTSVEAYRCELNVIDGAEELAEAKFWIKQAELCTTQNHYPRNRTSCSLYGGCVFRRVCAAPQAARQLILEQEFEQRLD